MEDDARREATRVTKAKTNGRVVAIDGPAGTGKSTIAKRLAHALQLPYLDTGAMYRAITFAALSRDVDPDDVERVASIAESAEIVFSDDDSVRIDGVDATVEIRGPEVTRAVSIVAANAQVRAEMRAQQREWVRKRGGGVVEGRDIGTVVFPDASLKVFLTARPEIRAARRAKEVTDLDYATVAADLARRDALDQGREHNPLAIADDAVIIDTSDMTIDEIVDDLVRRL
jgi:cytidylate kinase